ncbi:hypothetical protein ACJZ2D_015659 [Fusarium nematophilum]
MSLHDSPAASDDNDIVVIDRDDVSNYNPDNILPESPDTIARIRDWLRPTKYNLDSGEYRKHLASHLESTGDWLPQSDEYKKWHDSPEHGLLWIKGVPGSGKSVIAATLAHILSQEDVPVLFFFFRQIIDANHQPINLLRDWLDQILLYSPPLQSILKEYVDSPRPLDSVSVAELWRHLRVALASLPLTYCVIDALDEMDQGNDDFIASLAGLGRWRPSTVKVLMTSRPVASVERPMRPISYIGARMEERLVDLDISTYVQHCLSHSSLSEQDQELVRKAVPGRANGLFLYAKLAMKAFLEPDADISSTIQRLPLDLDDMYIDMLQEHARRSGISEMTQMLILQWATHATRPLRLLELADMLKTTVDDRKQFSLKDNKDLVRAACGPLLEILPDETVSVVHHSLTEFLVGSSRPKRSAGYPVLEPTSAHSRLAISCLEYLFSGCFSDLETPRRLLVEAQPIVNRMNLDFPFSAYAIGNWDVHAARSKWSGLPDEPLSQQIVRFLKDSCVWQTWLTLRLWYRSDMPEREGDVPSFSGLHVLAYCGLETYIPTLLGQEPSGVIDAGDSQGRTPLWWAANQGHTGAVRSLLEAGAAPDAGDRYYRKPLHQAAWNDHSDAVKLLLDHGVDLMITNVPEDPRRLDVVADTRALEYACRGGKVKSVEAFLPFLSRDTKQLALRWATEWDCPDIIKRLLQEPDVDVNEQTSGTTPLFIAAMKSNIESMGALVDAGADVSLISLSSLGMARSNTPAIWCTPLAELCRQQCLIPGPPNSSRIPWPRDRVPISFGQPDFLGGLSLLIRAGADVNARDSSGHAPIHVAKIPDVIRHLIDAGADPNAETPDGETALHLLPLHSNRDLVKLIVEGGADINKREHRAGQTPLIVAIRRNFDLGLFMLQYKPDCNATDIEGNGPLHHALASGERRDNLLPLLSGLLEAGADPKLANCRGETPLHTFARNASVGHVDSIRLLLKFGASINTRDSQGRTPVFRLFNTYNRKDDWLPLIDAFQEAGARLDVRDNQGRSLLHEAVREISSNAFVRQDVGKIYRHLVDAGISPPAVDFKGNTLCHGLVLSGEHVIQRELASTLLSLFERSGLDLDQPNLAGTTPLHLVCQMPPAEKLVHVNATGCFKLLLDHSADPNAADTWGLRPIHFAASTDEYTVNHLLYAGADPFAPTNQGMNVLHIATRCRRGNVVGLLLEWMKKLDPAAMAQAVNQKDGQEFTPLHYACRSGRIESVLLLLDAGADVNPTFSGSPRSVAGEPWYPPVLQCVFFKKEQGLWKDDNSRKVQGRGRVAAGFTIEDTNRPRDGGSHLRAPREGTFDPIHDIARCDDIIRALLSAGANIYDDTHWSHSALEKTWKTVENLLRDREYLLITELYKAGADFASPNDMGISILQRLTELGFSRLVDDCCSPEEARQFDDAKWRSQKTLKDADHSIKPLVVAACLRSCPNMDVLRVLVEKKGVDVSAQAPGNGPQALHHLARGGHWWQLAQAMPYLVSKGADLEARDSNGETPLHHAVGGLGPLCAAAVKALLDLGADVHATDSLGEGCLAKAARNEELVRILVSHGAVVDSSAISSAVLTRNLGVLKALLSSGGALDPTTRSWNLTMKDAQGPDSARVIETWLRYREHPLYSATGTDGLGPNPPEPEMVQASEDTMKALLEAGVSPYESYLFVEPRLRVEGRLSLPAYAAQTIWDRNRTELEIDDPGWGVGRPYLVAESVVLHQILSKGRLFEPFLELPNLDMEYRDGYGRTPLLAACRKHAIYDWQAQRRPVQRLLANGADPTAVDDDGRNVLHHLLGCDFLEPERLSVLEQFGDIVPSLINKADSFGYCPLHYGLASLVTRGCPPEEPEWLGYIASHGADMTVTDGQGNNALHYLASGLRRAADDPDVLDDLFTRFVGSGLDVNTRNKAGQTPAFFLFWGREDEDEEAVEETMGLLDGLGVDWLVRDAKGRTILHEMGDEGELLYKAIADRGVDPLLEDDEGRSSLDLAAALENQPVLMLFERKS